MPERLSHQLTERGVITADTAEQALLHQVMHGGALDTAILELELAGEGAVMEALAAAYPQPLATPDILDEPAEPRALRALPEQWAIKHELAPLGLSGDTLHVLSCAPVDAGRLRRLGELLELTLVPQISTELRVQERLAALYERPLPERFERLERQLRGELTGPVEPPPITADISEAPLSLAEAEALLMRAHDRDRMLLVALRYALSQLDFAAFFVPQHDLLEGLIGLGKGGDRVRGLQVALHPRSAFGVVIDNAAQYLGPLPKLSTHQALSAQLGRPVPATALILPLRMRSRVVALLYGEGGEDGISPQLAGELMLFMTQVEVALAQLLTESKRPHSVTPEPLPIPPLVQPEPVPELEPPAAVEVDIQDLETAPPDAEPLPAPTPLPADEDGSHEDAPSEAAAGQDAPAGEAAETWAAEIPSVFGGLGVAPETHTAPPPQDYPQAALADADALATPERSTLPPPASETPESPQTEQKTAEEAIAPLAQLAEAEPEGPATTPQPILGPATTPQPVLDAAPDSVAPEGPVTEPQPLGDAAGPEDAPDSAVPAQEAPLGLLDETTEDTQEAPSPSANLDEAPEDAHEASPPNEDLLDEGAPEDSPEKARPLSEDLLGEDAEPPETQDSLQVPAVDPSADLLGELGPNTDPDLAPAPPNTDPIDPVFDAKAIAEVPATDATEDLPEDEESATEDLPLDGLTPAELAAAGGLTASAAISGRLTTSAATSEDRSPPQGEDEADDTTDLSDEPGEGALPEGADSAAPSPIVDSSEEASASESEETPEAEELAPEEGEASTELDAAEAEETDETVTPAPDDDAADETVTPAPDDDAADETVAPTPDDEGAETAADTLPPEAEPNDEAAEATAEEDTLKPAPAEGAAEATDEDAQAPAMEDAPLKAEPASAVDAPPEEASIDAPAPQDAAQAAEEPQPFLLNELAEDGDAPLTEDGAFAIEDTGELVDRWRQEPPAGLLGPSWTKQSQLAIPDDPNAEWASVDLEPPEEAGEAYEETGDPAPQDPDWKPSLEGFEPGHALLGPEGLEASSEEPETDAGGLLEALSDLPGSHLSGSRAILVEDRTVPDLSAEAWIRAATEVAPPSRPTSPELLELASRPPSPREGAPSPTPQPIELEPAERVEQTEVTGEPSFSSAPPVEQAEVVAQTPAPETEGPTELVREPADPERERTEVVRGDPLEEDSPPNARIALETALSDLDSPLAHLQKQAVAQLSSMLGPTVLPELIERFPGRLRVDPFETQDELPPFAQCSPLLEVIAHFGPQAHLYIRQRLEAKDRVVRFFATYFYAAVYLPEAIPKLLHRLHDGESRICMLAARTLFRYRDHPSFQLVQTHVRGRLDASSVGARRHATFLAGLFRDTSLIPRLIQVFEDRDKPMYALTEQALGEITKQRLGSSARRWNSWWNKHRSESRIQWLIDGLSSRDEALRKSSVEELRVVSNEYMGFDPQGPRRDREAARKLWLSWWEEYQQER